MVFNQNLNTIYSRIINFFKKGTFLDIIIKSLSFVLVIYPISVLIYGISDYFFKLNWKLPCGYNDISFVVFMTCLFSFILFMMLKEQDKLVTRAVFGSILLFSIFNPTVFNGLSWVITILFSILLLNLIWRIWKGQG